MDWREPEALPRAERLARDQPGGLERRDAPPRRVARILQRSRHTESIADDGSQAVGSDQDVTSRTRAIGKSNSHAVVVLLDIPSLMARMDRDIARCVDKHREEVGTMKDHDRQAEPRDELIGGRAGQNSAVFAAESSIHADEAHAVERRPQSELIERLQRVRPERDARADIGQDRTALVDIDVDAFLLQGESGGQAADAGADDDYAHVMNVIRGENEITKRKILNRRDRSSGGIFQKEPPAPMFRMFFSRSPILLLRMILLLPILSQHRSRYVEYLTRTPAANTFVPSSVTPGRPSSATSRRRGSAARNGRPASVT
jgi:hypothetical protein